MDGAIVLREVLERVGNDNDLKVLLLPLCLDHPGSGMLVV
jgi:hypothetical protein